MSEHCGGDTSGQEEGGRAEVKHDEQEPTTAIDTILVTVGSVAGKHSSLLLLFTVT